MDSQNKKDRVVVSGMGLLTPIGIGIEENWSALMAGKSGIATIDKFDPSGLSTQFAGEIKGFDPKAYLDGKKIRQYDRFIHLSIAAGDMALENAGLAQTDLPKERTAILVGSGMGGVETFYNNAIALHEKGARRVSPYFVPSTISSMASGLMAIRYQTHGANYAIVSACATGAHSIGEGYRMIQNDEADIVIAGGAEAAVTPLCIAGFAVTKALSRRNDAPRQASRPFDNARDGFVLGEGAGVLILERESHAKARNARIYAALIGTGYSSDAFHPTAPHEDGFGAALAMELALKRADVAPGELGYINAHSTSTGLGDRAETRAMRKTLGDAWDRVAVSATKSMTGHLLGAAGAVEAAYTVLALHNGQLPPTINLDDIDPECEMDHVANTPRTSEVNFALSNAFGFGGTNASLVFSRS